MANKFIGFLEAVGKDFLKGLGFAVKYAIPVEKLVALLFPTLAPEATAAVGATTLLQSAILLVEQKYAASGVQNGTGQQKTAEVLLLSEQAVTSLLAQAGIHADTSYIQNLISAIVAIMNVQAVPTGA
jgi:hypothetical protein